MKYSLKGITTEELSFKKTTVKIEPGQKIEIKPKFSREVKTLIANKSIKFVNLTVKVESTETEPKPFEIIVSLTGVYETDIPDDFSEKKFVVEATKEIYAYLRASVNNLTALSFVSPFVLPSLSEPLFPEDRIEAFMN
ncbi:MAG: protein-export chaperone SecB [Clostridia bacterium]|nr:protein-export chaperone SecB [Clostridia bacterium]